MLCSNCKTDMLITRTEYFAEGDNSSQTPTRLFHRAFFSCRSKECPRYKTEQAGAPTLLYSSDMGANASDDA